jgi:hypothetical protein
MAGNRSIRAVSILLFAMIGLSLAGFSQRRASYLIDADIPRIEAGAAGGSIPREIELAAAYLAGRGVARDEKQAAYWYEKAADSGDPAAQEEIGYFYQAGIGVERDPARAALWFERAVAGGLISAKVNLGVAYVWGLGVHKDPAFAIQLFREAAQKGSGMGACYLGDMYYFGIGVAKSEADAKHWFERGSKLHNIPAKVDLALLLLGQVGQPSRDQAIRLLREASAGGSVAAKHQLGLEMIHASERSGSLRGAVKLLEEAASDGYWKSSATLGVLSREGRGTPKDSRLSYYHFRVAALQGGEKAAKLLENDLRSLASQLSQVQVGKIDHEADAWSQSHRRPLDFVNLRNDYANNFPAFALESPQREDVHAALLLEAPDANETP